MTTVIASEQIFAIIIIDVIIAARGFTPNQLDLSIQ